MAAEGWLVKMTAAYRTTHYVLLPGLLQSSHSKAVIAWPSWGAK